MEQIFYWIVKTLSAGYILYKIFRFLFGEKVKNRWRFLTPKAQEKKEQEKPKSTPKQTTYSIVGKSHTVYLEEPPKEKPLEPVFSEDLQQVSAYEEEADISSDDVENDLTEGILSEEERFTLLDIEPDSEAISTGMTYEQISQALEVIQGKNTGDSDKSAVARILYEVQGSELFDFLTAQAENEAIIERLLKENLDETGEILPKSRKKNGKEIEKFDLEKYV